MQKLLVIILFLLPTQLSYGQLRIGTIKSDSLYEQRIDTVYGTTISFFAKNNYEIINGLDIGLIANKGNLVNGVTVAPIYNSLDRFNGLVMGGIANFVGGHNSNGLIFSSAFNKIYADKFSGISITGGLNYFSNNYIPSSTTGLILAGLVNKIKSNYTTGFILGGLYNSFGNNFKGIAISAIGNHGGTTKGVLVGAVNSTNISSGLMVGLFNKDIQANGVKIGVVNMTTAYNSSGFSISLLGNHNINYQLSDNAIFRCEGFYVSGGINLFNQFSGVAISGVGNLSTDLRGVAITPSINLIGKGKGLAIGGLLNYVIEDFKGVSISLINIGKASFQFGLINISPSSRLQIGLFNYNKKSKLKFLPFVNIGQADN